jgi:chromosome transmission fidelity protein 1
MDEREVGSAAFPTSKDVPFPYPNPYPQQLDLMDAVLLSLKFRGSSYHSNSPLDPSPSGRSPSNPRKASVWMLESPTGTGKSLSLCCSLLAWLQYAEERDLQPPSSDDTTGANDIGNDDDHKAPLHPDRTGIDWLDSWQSPDEIYRQKLAAQVRERAMNARVRLGDAIRGIRTDDDVADRSRRLSRRQDALRRALDTTKIAQQKSKKRKRAKVSVVSMSNYVDLCLDDYRSDEESGKATAQDSISLSYEDSDDDEADEQFPSMLLIGNRSSASTSLQSDAESLLSGAALDGSLALKAVRPSSLPPPKPVASVAAGSGVRKIIYAARTHSQLSQFVAEFAKTPFATSHRIVALGGRKSLCANPDVLKLSSERAMNDACLDLKYSCAQRSSSAAVSTLALHTLAHPTPIEEASDLGRKCGVCGYYASRVALPGAHIVALPYSMLLSPRTRQSIGLSLQGSIVVVDEAHNLPEALRSQHSTSLSLPVVQSALQQLNKYVQRYSQRLAGRNLNYLGQLARLCRAIVKYLEKMSKNSNEKERRMVTPEELMTELRLGNMNLFKILRYLEYTRLSQKLMGFRCQYSPSENAPNKDSAEVPIDDGLSKHVSAMSVVQTFIEKISFSGQEGKIVIDIPPVPSSDVQERVATVSYAALRYVLLRPAVFFENILEEAHALALVGGTLRPFVHVAAELLGQEGDWIERAAAADAQMQASSPQKVSDAVVTPEFTAFTCDHVVSASNVFLQCYASGPTGQRLDFRHQARSSPLVCDELGRLINDVCRIVPSGVVVFVPSYGYEMFLVKHWQTTGLWHELSKSKVLHREPKNPQQLDSSLQAFARDAKHGALLFSVIGGKMSEGINFSDDMARCVIVVGLPFPDITDAELKEKMDSMDASPNQVVSGQAYYQNLCMRAVNQSVGRAIRHANDYASILLVDARYRSDQRVWSGLPRWLKKGASNLNQMDSAFSFQHQELQNFHLDKLR